MAGCYECGESPCRVGIWRVARCPLRGRFGEEARYQQFRQALRVTQGVAVTSPRRSALPKGAVDRVRWYLQVMDEYARRGLPTISSHHLARAVGVRSGLVRRDLAGLGHFGTPGRGYELAALRRAVRRALKLDELRAAVWFGAKRLREDREAQQALRQMNCRLAAVFDGDPGEIGHKVAGLPVRALAEVEKQVKAAGAEVAVVASKQAATPELMRGLVQAGVRGVLNLTNSPLPASGGVVIEQADVSSQLVRMLARVGPAQGDVSSRSRGAR